MMRCPLFYLLVLVALLCMVFPFYWIFVTSFKAPGEISSNRLALYPRTPLLRATEFELTTAKAAAVADKTVTDWLEAEESEGRVAQYSVDFSRTPGRVNVLFDSGRTGLSALRSALESLQLTVVNTPTLAPYDAAVNYRQVFRVLPFHLYLRNSAIVASITTFFCLLVGAFCAYALARLQFPLRDAVLSLILAVSMFPPIAVVSPLFLVMKKAHLLNTYGALIIPYVAFSLPLTIWVLTGFFRDLPLDLEEAARVDGCTRMQTFIRIILPLAAPGVFTCAILVFISAWNEFLFALVFITKNVLRTVPVGITMFPGQFDMPWGTIFAAATIVTLPLVVLVFIFQRRIIAGLTAGAVKG